MQHAYMRVSVCNHVTGFQNYPKQLENRWIVRAMTSCV